jgi:hypothetical protein
MYEQIAHVQKATFGLKYIACFEQTVQSTYMSIYIIILPLRCMLSCCVHTRLIAHHMSQGHHAFPAFLVFLCPEENDQMVLDCYGGVVVV